MVERNISILWDFDGTLTPNKDSKGNYVDSTSQTIKVLSRGKREKEYVKNFWSNVQKIKGSHLL